MEPGLRAALAIVEAEAARVRADGLSRFTFFLGLATCVATAFLIGKYPASVWIVYAAQALIILGWRFSVELRKTNPRTMLFFLDFCWMANIIIAFLAFVCLFEVLDKVLLGDIVPHVNLADRYPDIGRIICLIATGPLGASIIPLKNALVLHDIEQFSGCFIHLWPVFTTLSVRWNPALVMEKYPGLFDSLTGFHDSPAGESDLLELIKLGVVTYLAWWIPFTLWMLVHGRHQSNLKTGWTTVYLNLVMREATVRKVVGVRGGDEDAIVSSASGIAPTLKYMAVHGAASTTSLVFSALCYKYMRLHLIYCIVLVCVSLYNASKRYEWMLTERYGQAIRKHIEMEYPAEAASIQKGKDQTETGTQPKDAPNLLTDRLGKAVLKQTTVENCAEAALVQKDVKHEGQRQRKRHSNRRHRFD